MLSVCFLFAFTLLCVLTWLPRILARYMGGNSLTGTIPFNFLDGVENKGLSMEVDLISNRLSGSLPPSLTQFNDLAFFVAGNRISGIADGLCRKDTWMRGAVGDFQCNAILCPPDTYSSYGRQRDASSLCHDCPAGETAAYYGSFRCVGEEGSQSLSERGLLENLYRGLEGDNWKNKLGWLSDQSFCNWAGITCVADKESVSSIDLAGNGLRGSFPTQVYELPSLSRLNVAQNEVDFSFTGIARATNLEYLQLDDTGTPRSLSGLDMATNMKVLHMANNHFVNEDFSAVVSLSKLESLDLSNNAVGSLPSLASQSNLKHVDFRECGISGKIPSWLTSLSLLEYIHFDGNSLSGALPSSLSDLVNLKYMSFADQLSNGGTGITGTLPDFVGLSSLRELYLQSNKLTGTLAESFLADVPNDAAVTVDLRGNALHGSIPEALTRISDLNLYLASNEIDSIPESVCSTSWNDKAGSSGNCDHIMCSKGSFNAIGRATPTLSCTPCTEDGYASYFGSTDCGPNFEKHIVFGLFESLGGRNYSFVNPAR